MCVKTQINANYRRNNFISLRFDTHSFYFRGL